jgi:hypothetical protein
MVTFYPRTSGRGDTNLRTGRNLVEGLIGKIGKLLDSKKKRDADEEWEFPLADPGM